MSNEKQNPGNPGSAPGNPDIVEAGKATRFRPGQSGNPSGRPPTKLLTEGLRKRLDSPIPAQLASELGLLSEATFAEAINARLSRDAANGNIAAIHVVYERIEGKPPKEVVCDEQKNVVLRVIYDTNTGQSTDQIAQLASRAEDEEIKTAATALEILLRKAAEGPDAKKRLEQSVG